MCGGGVRMLAVCLGVFCFVMLGEGLLGLCVLSPCQGVLYGHFL